MCTEHGVREYTKAMVTGRAIDNRYYSQGRTLFLQVPLSQDLDEMKQYARNAAETVNYKDFAGKSVEEISEEIFDAFKVNEITLLTDEIFLSEANPEQTQVLRFTLPFEGDELLFHRRPHEFMTVAPEGWTEKDKSELHFSVTNPGTPEGVKANINVYVSQLNWWLERINGNVRVYNTQIRDTITQMLERKSKTIKSGQAFLSTLNYPVTRNKDVVSVIAPIQRKPKPPIVSSTIKRVKSKEYSIDENAYQNILDDLHHMALVFERSPKAFSKMGEEDIRWVFLVALNAQYQGMASGETFNFEGKTDILIRYHDKNLFIAECKIWKGKEVLLKTIDQVVGYTTWRDAKAAIMIFNRNKGFSSILDQIIATVKEHDAFEEYLGTSRETEFKFRLKRPDDQERKLTLTVLAFDLPT